MLILLLTIVGLSLGSFVNALVYRIHEQDKTKSKAKRRQLSIVHGRSMCPSCRHVLAPTDLVPLFSWLWLRGKCRYCQKPIPDTPVPELLVPLLFIVSYVFWPVDLGGWNIVNFGFWLVTLVGLVALFLYDLRWYLLPNRLVYPLIAIAALHVALSAAFSSYGAVSVLGSASWGLIVGGGIFWVLFQVSGGRWIGGGDVKLGWLLGLLVGGPVASFVLIFLASLLGSLVGVPLLLTGGLGRQRRLPFGPFLITAAFIVQLFGATLVSWYKRQVGL